ncbi:Transcription factor bHLH [Abeliophyllum distichum]|uniref:Transcription factor bHLH n=1 Tax=Abeliophyllum distichum TaxID=126358 RepID=A0ABD1TGB2_9LAMI
MASSSISNPDTNSNPLPKKRRKIDPELEPRISTADTERSRWRTEAEQRNYSIKLLKALRHIRRRGDSSSATRRSIRGAADRVLAVSAKGRTRWSRAILTSRLRLRLAQINKKHKKAKVSSDNRLKKPDVKNKPPSLQRNVRILGSLVPGCRRLSFPNLLEETTDYIAALKMQVKAMTFLAELLAGNDTLVGSSDQLGSDGVTSN